MGHKCVQRFALNVFFYHIDIIGVLVDIIYEGDSWMVQIHEKQSFRREVSLQGERSCQRGVFGDTLDGTTDLHFQMFGKVYGAKAAGTECG